jgi:hypothetical protein
MPETEPEVLALERLDAACDRFESEWKAGGNPRIEDYLANAAQPDREALLAALLAVEIELRRRDGLPIDTASYSARFPDHHGTVEPILGDHFGNLAAATPGIPGYEVLGELGRGAMGIVYRARQAGLNRVIALKTVRHPDPDPLTLIRFLAEAEVVAAVRHPNVVQVFDTGRHAGTPYLAMEYLPGGTLADRLRGGVRLDPEPGKRVNRSRYAPLG